ncbi:12091_t:CDS:2 [Funneliformis geosporum]|uniref:12091_t:CDS:1 n=1 Tax=Funneliformis geosporum TaxID=1117311 RepID=A0A9W4T0T6_9GLOM|nr:12091_t:CDS:2 [Funneliformis geosporum]
MNKFILIIIFFFTSFDTKIVAFTPKARHSHASIVVDGKVYYFGGITPTTEGSQILSNEMFYFDITKEVDTSSILWVDQTATSPMSVQTEGATTVVGSNDNNTIFMVGGTMFHPKTNTLEMNALVYAFNINNQIWSKVEVLGATPPGRKQAKGVIDPNGKIYLFCGINANYVSGGVIGYLGGMEIFDTKSLSWSTVTSDNTEWRGQYSATILENGNIIYLGGLTMLNADVDISKAYIYNTNTGIWSTEGIKGDATITIDNRYGHSAVLYKGKIIIYGGAKGLNQVTPNPSLVFLKVDGEQYVWETPQTLTIDNPPLPVSHHSAEIVGDFMIVAFGNVTNNLTLPTSANDKVFLFNLNTYSWVSHFNPPPPPSQTDTDGKNSSTDAGGNPILTDGSNGYLTPSKTFHVL